jgi:hypothetical protein
MKQKRAAPKKVLRLCLAGAAAGGMILFSVNCIAGRGAASAGIRAQSGAGYYLDCSAKKNGNGTRSRPWNTVDTVNRRTFGPGDTLFIRRGTTVTREIAETPGRWFKGVLEPHGSGVVRQPIVVDAYGTGAAPVIDAQGRRGTAAILLRDEEYWTIRNVEVRNDVPVHDRASQGYRWGIYVFTGSGKVRHGIHIEGNTVRNVYGSYSSVGRGGEPYGYAGAERTGGIFIHAITPPGGWDGVLIDSNEIADIWGEGIGFLSGIGPGRWSNLSTGVVIRGNSIRRTADMGIYVVGTENALIEYNVIDSAAQMAKAADSIGVDGSGQTVCDFTTGMSCAGGVGLMVFRNGLIQYNEVSRTKMWKGDGMAFDNDHSGTGQTVFQYNYSHDNGGPFFSECVNESGDSSYAGTIVRYNISVNDGIDSSGPHGNGAIARPSTYIDHSRGNAHVYNNVFYSAGIIHLLFNSAAARNDTFYNNIFYGDSVHWDGHLTGNIFDHNCYYGFPPTEVPANHTNTITADPQFTNAGGGGGGRSAAGCYKLQSASPCIDAGRVIGNNGGRDFWGNTLYHGQPDIGAYENPASGLYRRPATDPSCTP